MSYCDWGKSSKLNREYHDCEWGVPVFDDRRHFEYITLELMQCGLSWDLIIKKRKILSKCFDGFDFEKIAAYSPADIDRILSTDGMIRSVKKTEAVISNAKCFIAVRDEFGSFSNFIWGFTGGKSIVYNKHPDGFIPACNALSEKISLELKKRGFKYTGAVTVYSYLQACGIINDHGKDCPCFDKIRLNFPTVEKRRWGEKHIGFYADGKK